MIVYSLKTSPASPRTDRRGSLRSQRVEDRCSHEQIRVAQRRSECGAAVGLGHGNGRIGPCCRGTKRGTPHAPIGVVKKWNGNGIEVMHAALESATYVIITLPHSANREPLIAAAKLIKPELKAVETFIGKHARGETTAGAER